VGAGVVMASLVHESNVVARVLMRVSPGVRNRFLADKLIMYKLGIELALGIVGKVSAEFERRRGNFFKEFDFVIANIITAVIADVALVYFPAPVASLTGAASGGANASWLSRQIHAMPGNIFQRDRPYPLALRAGSLGYKMSQLFVAGFFANLLGVSIVNGSVAAREFLDPTWKNPNPKSDVVKSASLYATFLGVSAACRYQLVNGIEDNVFPMLMKGLPGQVEHAATLALRLGNTFWGSQQWVIFAQMTGVQKAAEAPREAARAGATN